MKGKLEIFLFRIFDFSIRIFGFSDDRDSKVAIFLLDHKARNENHVTRKTQTEDSYSELLEFGD